MDIEEMKLKKLKLESDICSLLKNFEDLTGLFIEEVNLIKYKVIGITNHVNDVEIDVKL